MRSRRSAIATFLLVIGSLLLPAGRVAADQEALCGDVQLVHARGTGDQVNDDFFLRVDDQLRNRLGTPPISYSTYQLGKDGGFGGFDYPAAGDRMEFLLEASLNASQLYQDSRDEGIAELVAYLNHRTAQCPGEMYVLTGHSQGADVTGRALAELSNGILDRIAFVALFGDPRFQTYNTQVIAFVDQCYFPRPVWQRGTSECYSHGWYADDFAPYLPDAILDRVGSWCRDGDVACTGIPQDILTAEEHTRYHLEGDVDMAMQEAAVHLAALQPGMADDIDVSMLQFATGNAGADLAFVFDTTGSMFNEIDDVAAQASALAGLWLDLSPNGRVALVEFRDHGDSFVSRVALDLTNDGAAFQTAVSGLVADEGGDTPEAQLSGLMTTLNELEWQVGATKAAVVITDAPGKDPEPVTNFTRPQVSQRALEIDPVAIYGVDVINDPAVADFMQPLAADTAGEVVVLQPGQSLSDLLEGLLNTVALNPVATLHGPYFADVGDPVHFTAAGSFDPDGELASYEWDFDGDGSVDQTTTAPVVDHTYPAAFSGFAAVRVVAADGGEALATAAVTVQSGGLTPVAPVTPAAASASVTGPGAVTVTWTPAPNDNADGYTVRLDDTILYRYVEVGSGNSVTITGLDLSEPQTFSVRAANEYGQSPAAVTSPVGGVAAVTTQLVSISTTRAKGNGASLDAYVSADGRLVVYHSDATNLDPADTNNVRDVFVRDRLAGTTTLVSASAAGVVGNGISQDPAISKGGRYVTFRSQANNLVSGDTNGTAWDIFVKDLQTGAIDRVSVSTAGAQANGTSQNPVISADGRYVAYRSSATNLVTGDTNGQPDVFVRDRQTATTTRVSVATGGTQATGGVSDEPAISDDGRYVAFQSAATNLVTGDTNALTDIFRHDRQTTTTIRLSVSSAGAQATGASGDPSINGDGSRVVFKSLAANLVTGDTNAKEDIFVRLVATSETIRASLSNSGAQVTSSSSDPSISTDGTKVAFYSTASALVTSDTNNRGDVFVRDLTANTTERKSLTATDAQVNDASSAPWLAGDGSAVAFASVGTNLVPEDTDATSDIYVRGPSMAN